MNGWHVAPPRSQPMSSRARPWATPPKDPLERVLDLGGKKALRIMAGAIALTLFFHGVAAARTAYIHAEVISWTLHIDALIDHHLQQQIDIETETPQAKKEELKPIEPTPVDVAPKPVQQVAAAQAAQVIARTDNDVLDFSGNVFTVGSSERYSGGETKSNGTNDHPPPPAHTVADTGAHDAPPPKIEDHDYSRLATLAGSGEWRCPFPPEADADQVDEAAAIIEVVVGADGKAQRANILQDPGHGFGREARSCAMRESYVPALDKAGNAVSSSKKFRVKFER